MFMNKNQAFQQFVAQVLIFSFYKFELNFGKIAFWLNGFILRKKLFCMPKRYGYSIVIYCGTNEN